MKYANINAITCCINLQLIISIQVKHHRGGGQGTRVWILGLVETETNKLILYPVQDRTEATLVEIILKHVEPGSTVLTDGWSSYLNLNKEGFKHFTVNHKKTFKQVYVNELTNDRMVVHTNTIEGAWARSKEEFK